MNSTSNLETPAPPRPPPHPLPVWQSATAALETLAQEFSPVSLKEMTDVTLLNRIDFKYAMPTAQVLRAISKVPREYRILSIQNRRLIRYRTLYFDTPDFGLYRAHVNGQAERFKVRSREYTDSQKSFLEVKEKTRKGRTIKQRLPTPELATRLTPEIRDWLRGAYPEENGTLEPKIWIAYRRMTLVSRRYCERVTIDVDLAFLTAERIVRLDGIAVAEVKTNTIRRDSPFRAQMLAQRIPQCGFSKYAVGVSLLNDSVKKNNLKPVRLWIGKMQQGENPHA
ncbi:MAG: polyphosphate polymerase domain-containing protein [Anaerolineales bacterium]|nr:polyphosphate polymerase domain-containing protein [Anaerolineales bacterium]